MNMRVCKKRCLYFQWNLTAPASISQSLQADVVCNIKAVAVEVSVGRHLFTWSLVLEVAASATAGGCPSSAPDDSTLIPDGVRYETTRLEYFT